jgi:hypothetical protein
MSKTPEEYRELFSQIEKKMNSTSPDDLALVVTPEFKEVVEALASEFQSIAPGMEGMMGFARENGFDKSGVLGIWMAVGIAATTKGPRQKDWLKQVRELFKNVGREVGFAPVIRAMAHVLHNTSIEDKGAMFFPDSFVVDDDHSTPLEVDMRGALSWVQIPPEVEKTIRDFEKKQSIKLGAKKTGADDGLGR